MIIQEESTITDRSEFIKGGTVGFLLVHSLGGTPVELRLVAHGLARRGHTVNCCQLAGHCGTPEELRRSNWRQWYASVEAAHDRLREHCDIIFAGGQSMGGILALHLAQNRAAEVDGLLLYAPTFRLDGWAMPWYLALLHLIRPTPLNLKIDLVEREPFGLKDERVRALVVKSMQAGDSSQAGSYVTPMRALANFNQLVSVVKRNLSRVQQPTLIVHPRNDDMASIKNAQYLQRYLGGLVDTVILENSYHIVTLDQQRHIVVGRTVEFVDWIVERIADRQQVARIIARNQAGDRT
jgi:carboxylesterase